MLNISPVNLICIVLNLLILVMLMKKFLYQPVLSVIAKRQELIDGQLARAEETKQEAQQLKEQYTACLSGAKEEKEQALKEAKAQARDEYDRIVASADEKAAQILKKAKETGEAEKSRAMEEAGADIAKLVASAAAKLVSESQSEEKNQVMYDEFLKKAGEMSEAGSR